MSTKIQIDSWFLFLSSCEFSANTPVYSLYICGNLSDTHGTNMLGQEERRLYNNPQGFLSSKLCQSTVLAIFEILWMWMVWKRRLNFYFCIPLIVSGFTLVILLLVCEDSLYMPDTEFASIVEVVHVGFFFFSFCYFKLYCLLLLSWKIFLNVYLRGEKKFKCCLFER